MKNFKALMPSALKTKVHTLLNQKELCLPTGNKAFIFLAADYGNIGDLAITRAQELFLESTLSNYSIVRVPISQTRLVIKSVKKKIRKEDIVTIVGGGNMGSLYPDIEELRQLVISSFPENKIICFPQSLDWDSTRKSDRALEKIVKCYGLHNDIHIFARESFSYEKMKELFSIKESNLYYCPDIVLSSTLSSFTTIVNVESNSIGLCLRDDKEKIISNDSYNFLKEKLSGIDKVVITDTHINKKNLSVAQANAELELKVVEFQKYKLIITDRLHGMILSLLAGTPCIVVPNSNHKINYTHKDWLYALPNIHLVEHDHIADIPSVAVDLISRKNSCALDKLVDESHFDVLRNTIIS